MNKSIMLIYLFLFILAAAWFNYTCPDQDLREYPSSQKAYISVLEKIDRMEAMK
jgi:hypothetical protein